MTIAFVLGNGLSRQGIAPAHLKTLGRVYGCNALYREFTPDVLVATDRPIAGAIQESGYATTNKFYTRRPLPNLGAQVVPKSYFGFSSGPIASALAALDSNHRVYMLGFDMGPNQDKKFNNIYADTKYYKTSDSQPTYTGNWIKQIIAIANDFPTVQFLRVIGKTTAHVPDFETVKNIMHVPMPTFLDRINNQKDL